MRAWWVAVALRLRDVFERQRSRSPTESLLHDRRLDQLIKKSVLRFGSSTTCPIRPGPNGPSSSNSRSPTRRHRDPWRTHVRQQAHAGRAGRLFRGAHEDRATPEENRPEVGVGHVRNVRRGASGSSCGAVALQSLPSPTVLSGPERRAGSPTSRGEITVVKRNHAPQAEGGGFEPPSEENPRNGFRDRRIRPLCHPSAREPSTRFSRPRRAPRGSGTIGALERCPSGRRSATGNRVSGISRFEGSNPSLSAVCPGGARRSRDPAINPVRQPMRRRTGRARGATPG